MASPRSELGNDIDPSLHFGGGVKIYINRYVMLRLDLRDVVTHKQGVDNAFISHNLEALLGLSVTLGREKDRDTRSDRDGDGFYDDEDSCPDEAGVAPDGCPIRDSDGDGIDDPVDACVSEPETVNGFEDGDGCPDVLPEALVRFNGSIEGITFETGKATIRRESLPTLDAAVQTLLEYPDVRIEIAGHTDSKGKREDNLELSKARADSVASYLVGMGVEESRITTVGFGPDVPVDSNETKAGRAKNRRIEFRIVAGGAE
ncbi:MAG: OmpA family protein [Deltaproteobacteria bacterium]|nr:OmpA family protein [Deltaproteobacteria bacterium]